MCGASPLMAAFLFSRRQRLGDSLVHLLGDICPNVVAANWSLEVSQLCHEEDDPEENTNRVADPSSASLCQDLRAQLFYWFDNSQKQSRKTSLHDPHADV